MTQTLAVNDFNDIYIGRDGNLVIAYDLDAVLQACSQVAKSLLGEMVLAIDQGIPYFQTVWVGVPNLQQFESALRRAFLGVTGVVEVVSLVTSLTGDVLQYTAEIRTIYGSGVVNG